ncbi:hypothetical protein KI688_006075 [Linnemannia hyalina]|uniref:Uncharacterized protein n=1 Tax=Linnemannia hyalina TaxID=64524 RepID=A0A9P8BXZ1_9FUNG|nr:hypothetical protein KI688_006075 [Linnemannia hyalina]
MPGHQHQQQLRGIKQPSGSVLYLPRSEDEDMTSGETHKDVKSAALTPNSTEDQQPQAKEMEKIIFDTGIQELILKAADFWTDDPGATGDILNDLAYKLGGLVTLIGKPIIQATIPGVNDKGSEMAHDNGDKDLGNSNRKTTKPARLELYIDFQIAENRGRQIEISSLMSNTTDEIQG